MKLKRWLRPRSVLITARNAFDRTPDGRALLKYLLQSYGLLSRIESDEQRIRHNVGVELLEHLGVVQGMNWDRLVDDMLRLTIPKEAIEPESNVG